MDDLFRQTELGADFADFVFEELAQRLDELEFHPLRQAADIVVGFDQGRGIAGDGDALDDVGVKRTLREPAKFRLPACGFGSAARELRDRIVEDPDEFVADELALALGVGHAAELREEAPGSIHILELDAEIFAEDALDGLGFAGAEEAIVDENAGELVSDGLVEERRGDAGIDAAGKAEDDVIGADLLAKLGAGVLDEGAHRPIHFAAADPVDEVLEDFLAARGVRDFRVKLHAVEALFGMLDSGEGRVAGDADGPEAAGQSRELVAVGIPDIDDLAHALEERGVAQHLKLARAVFAAARVLDFPLQMKAHELHAVANAKDRQAEAKRSRDRAGARPFHKRWRVRPRG